MLDCSRANASGTAILGVCTVLCVYVIPSTITAAILLTKFSHARERQMYQYDLLMMELDRARDAPSPTAPQDDGDAANLAPLAMDAPPGPPTRLPPNAILTR